MRPFASFAIALLWSSSVCAMPPGDVMTAKEWLSSSSAIREAYVAGYTTGYITAASPARAVWMANCLDGKDASETESYIVHFGGKLTLEGHLPNSAPRLILAALEKACGPRQ